MRDQQLVKKVVNYFNNHQSTVRETAAALGISKSTVYIYLTEVMPNKKSLEILAKNKAERHLRGGQATKNKYQKGTV